MKEISKIDNEIIENTNNLTTEDVQAIQDYFIASLSKNTLRAYKASLKKYNEYCNKKKLDKYQSSTIASFLSYQAKQNKTVSTIDRDYSAIKYDMKINNISLSEKEKNNIDKVVKGIKNSKAGTKKNKKKALTGDLLKMLIIKNESDTLRAKRDKAILLVGFSTMCRRSELTELQINDITETATGYYINIRKSKTDQTGKGFIKYIERTNTMYCPVSALDDYIKSANITDGFIFRAINKSNKVNNQGLTAQTIARIIKTYTGRAGLNIKDFSGHSLRSGGITEAANAGASTRQIMEQSGHKSIQVVNEYIQITDKEKNYPLRGRL